MFKGVSQRFLLRSLMFALLLAGCRHKRTPPITAAAAKATRPVNIVMVVDRSGSLAMSGSCQALIASATAFADTFGRGRGKLGLVTFATTTYVNFPIANNFQTAKPSVATILSGMKCAGSTSTAQALWTGYQQLIGLNKPDEFNVILFFTDGEPTGVTFDMPIANSSPCSAYTPGPPLGADAYAMPPSGKGYIRGVYSTYFNLAQFFGVENQNGATGPDGLQFVANNDREPAPASTDCLYSRNWPANVGVTRDFLGLPAKDIYGNSANTSYRRVTLNADGFIDLKNPQNAPAMAANAADSAALNIRRGAVDPVSGGSLRNVEIFSIGLGNAPVQLSVEFLQRVSNSPQSPIYDRTLPTGLVLISPTAADIRAAFNAIAAIIANRK